MRLAHHLPAQAHYHQESPPGLSIRGIQDAVCAAFGITRLDLLSRRRTQPVVTARHVAMWLVRWHTPNTYPAIARAFAHRDHTTVMYGVSRVEQRMADDAAFAARVRKLAAALRDGDVDERADTRLDG